MTRNDVVLTLNVRHLRWIVLVAFIVVAALIAPHLSAQKIQSQYNDKFKVATDDGGIAIAASSDGKYVYLVGKKGLIVSDDFGKTGSWVQTLRLK